MSESREELEARIAAYIDGELPPAEAARLEVFLANTDPELANQVIGMLADKHRLRALHTVKAPPDLASRIMEQVERSSLLNGVEHFANPQRPWWQSRGFIAAITILVIGGFSYFLLTSVLPQESPWKKSLAANDSTDRPVPSAHRYEIGKSAAPEKAITDGPQITMGPSGTDQLQPAAPSLESKADESVVPASPAAAPASAVLAGKDRTIDNTKSGLTPLATSGADGNGAGFGGRGGGGGGFGEQTQTRGGVVAGVTGALSLNKALDALEPGATETGKSDQPLVLAFVARNSQDAVDFQSRLKDLTAGQAAAANGASRNNSNASENNYSSNGIVQNTTPSGNAPQQLAQHAASAISYHVALSMEQLQSLAQDFDLRTMSRGQVSYGITSSPADQKLKAADVVTVEPSSQPTTVPAAQALAQSTPDAGEVRQKRDIVAKQSEELQTSRSNAGPPAAATPQDEEQAPAAVPQAVAVQEQNRRTQNNSIDCIITIEPAKP